MHRKWVWIFQIEIADDVLKFSSFCWFWGLYLLPRVLQIYGGHQNSKTEFYPKFTCVHALFKFNRMSFWQFRLFFKWTISFHLYGWCEHARNVNKNWRIVHIVWICTMVGKNEANTSISIILEMPKKHVPKNFGWTKMIRCA